MQKTSLGQQGVKAENFHERHKGYIVFIYEKMFENIKRNIRKIKMLKYDLGTILLE